jgi:predicted component of type VI protein secretion system
VRATTLLLALILSGLALAGCGGGSSSLSKSAYESRIQADGKSVQTAIQGVAASTTSLATLAKAIDTAEAAVKKSADDLESLKPPADAAADTTTIVKGLRAIGSGLEAMKRAAAKGDTNAARAAALAISDAPQVRAAQRAADDLKKKGYDVGVIGT